MALNLLVRRVHNDVGKELERGMEEVFRDFTGGGGNKILMQNGSGKRDVPIAALFLAKVQDLLEIRPQTFIRFISDHRYR
jgi:hypothetical protein